jgi:hypothetical protein
MITPPCSNALTPRDLILALGWARHLDGVDNDLELRWNYGDGLLNP